MTDGRDAVLDHHLEALGSEALASFVADLWAARGYDVVRDERVVEASKGGRTRTIYPVARGRVGGDSPTDVDLVVAPGGGRRIREFADREGSRLLDTGDLREMLRYAVDPATSRELCARHLGAEPDALDPPLRMRAREATDRITGTVSVTGVVVVLLVAVLVATVGVVQPALGGNESPSDGEAADEVGDGDDVAASDVETGGDRAGDDGAPAGEAPTGFPAVRGASDDPEVVGRPNASALASVPGLGVDGVTNISALADAQRAALGNDSYTLWIDRYEPRVTPNGSERIQRDTDIAVAGDRYLYEATIETEDGRERVRSVYYDGEDWVVADYRTRPNVQRIDGDRGDNPIPFRPDWVGQTLVLQYLYSLDTNVTDVVRQDGELRFRLVGEALPPGGGLERIRNYRVVAYVGQDGLVHHAEATFSVVTSDGTVRIRFEWTYGRIGVTSVREPRWATAALSEPTPTETNGTPRLETTDASANRTNATATVTAG